MTTTRSRLAKALRPGLLGALLLLGACGPNWSLSQTIPLPNAAELDGRGSLAMTNQVALVGVPFPSGVVDVFNYSNVDGTWSSSPVQQLFPQTNGREAFGAAVAIDQFDGLTLAIAAPINDYYDGTHAGYVDIYTFSGSWGYRQTLTPPFGQSLCPAETLQEGFGFGKSVSLDNGLLVVGAGRFCDGKGLAFVFQRGDDGLYSPRGASPLMEDAAVQRGDANFGDSVAVENGIIVVSRPDTPSNTGPPKNGKVYVYYSDSAGMPQTQILTAVNAGTTFDNFGGAIGLASGDLAVRSNTSVSYFTGGPPYGQPIASRPVDPGAQPGSIGLDADTLVIGEPTRGPAGEVDIFDVSQGTIGQELVRTEPMPTTNQIGSAVAVDGNQLLVEAGSGAGAAILTFQKF